MRNRLLDNAPLLRLVACMIIGIVIAKYVTLSIPMLPVLAGIVIIALLLWKHKYLQSFAILLCFLIMGMYLMQRQMSIPDDSQNISYIDRSKAFFLNQRSKLLNRFADNGIDDDAYAVVAAMCLGDKSALTHHIKDTYSVSGASHVLALSGLHLGIIYMLLSLFLPLRRWPALSQLLIILSVWAFVFLVGMSVSVVRSAVMLTVYGILSIGNRDKMSLNALAFTAIVMLMCNPLWLFDVGFQMSFMAVLAILLFVPLFEDVFPAEYLMEHRWIKRIWGLAVVSCSAQLGVAPLIAFYFGRFSTYFLLTNFIVIPAAMVILWLSIVVLLFPSFAYILLYIVQLLNAVLLRITAMPGASIDNLHPSVLQVLLIYVLIFCIYLFIERIKPIMGWRASR
ncbi:ComEC/Rec2 family competence protein [Xylanibacter ruminicola]|nr:ComEC/Rec2 family competence protein [Xylanibacter ruminicola]